MKNVDWKTVAIALCVALMAILSCSAQNLAESVVRLERKVASHDTAFVFIRESLERIEITIRNKGG